LHKVATGGNGLPDRPIDGQFEPYRSRKKSPPHHGVNNAPFIAITIGNTKVHALEISACTLRAIDPMRLNPVWY
jgi:hypothetical protein